MAVADTSPIDQIAALRDAGTLGQLIHPQPGKQRQFVESDADIVIYGGANGGGKSYGLMLCPLFYLLNYPEFNATFFRRTFPEFIQAGGLIKESQKLFPLVGAEYNGSSHTWKFPNGSEAMFAHMQHEKHVTAKQGGQFAYIGIDELPTFEEVMFWGLWRRQRSVSGVRPFMRCTCNPDAESWVKRLIQWWINAETGFAIEERSGIIRWFYRDSDDELVWFESQQDAMEWWARTKPDEWKKVIDGERPMAYPTSLTFIPAKLSDNQILEEINPEYRTNLEGSPQEIQDIYLHGNWNVKIGEGEHFKREWVGEPVSPNALPEMKRYTRGYDLGATEKTPKNDPDYTCGTLIGEATDGRFYVMDHVFDRRTAFGVIELIKECAARDPDGTEINIPQDSGGGGKSTAEMYARALAGYNVRYSVEARSKDKNIDAKTYRFLPFAAQAEAGNVKIVRGDWNNRWLNVLGSYPKVRHDDDIDSTSRAFNSLFSGEKPFAIDNLIG